MPVSPVTVAPIVYVLVVQAIATLVTFAAPTVPVPVPVVKVQVCDGDEGWVRTVTA